MHKASYGVLYKYILVAGSTRDVAETEPTKEHSHDDDHAPGPSKRVCTESNRKYKKKWEKCTMMKILVVQCMPKMGTFNFHNEEFRRCLA